MSPSLTSFLKITPFLEAVSYQVIQEEITDSFTRFLIRYDNSDGDRIPAYLFVPNSKGPHPAVLVHHQHNGERHLGKAEVGGLQGDSLQAFGPALANQGFVVLAPDSICFEDRRKNMQGTEPGAGDSDWLQHFNELTYRLVKGDTLMRKVLDDASVALSLLSHLPYVDPARLGVMGHSYGGNTTLFQAATDDRVQFACASGAVCSYCYKIAHDIPFELALAIPGFYEHFDFADLVQAIAPRNFLIVSATEDQYSKDAPEVYKNSLPVFSKLGATEKLEHKHFIGGHALTQERFDYIMKWISKF